MTVEFRKDLLAGTLVLCEGCKEYAEHFYAVTWPTPICHRCGPLQMVRCPLEDDQYHFPDILRWYPSHLIAQARKMLYMAQMFQCQACSLVADHVCDEKTGTHSWTCPNCGPLEFVLGTTPGGALTHGLFPVGTGDFPAPVTSAPDLTHGAHYRDVAVSSAMKEREAVLAAAAEAEERAAARVRRVKRLSQAAMVLAIIGALLQVLSLWLNYLAYRALP